jgi:predicted transcriptional regulator
MKAFTLKLDRSPIEKMFEDLKRAVRTGIPQVHDDEMKCGSVEAMLQAISRSKFEAFAAIVAHKPRTLNELANFLGKDLGNVSRDVRDLEMIGLIELRREDSKDSRKIRPVAKYDQIVFDFSSGHLKAKK